LARCIACRSAKHTALHPRSWPNDDEAAQLQHFDNDEQEVSENLNLGWNMSDVLLWRMIQRLSVWCTSVRAGHHSILAQLFARG